MDEWQSDAARRGWKRKHTCFCVRLELPVLTLNAAFKEPAEFFDTFNGLAEEKFVPIADG